MFKISDKVIYIGVYDKIAAAEELTNSHNIIISGESVKKDKVYVINKIITNPAWKKNIHGLAFVGGLTAYDKRTCFEIGYDSRCFRKLEEIQAENRALKTIEKIVGRPLELNPS